ncbi:glutamine-hydrolyzing carbamoyl-phosphate synthase small subunit [Paracoccaceae bacterium GXU_MW_L88]
MATTSPKSGRDTATGAIVLATGEVFYGYGFGAAGTATGELCFNTAMTGYQEVMTDPSYAGQIITFTFPHIGNVGANVADEEADEPFAFGMITRELPTKPSNWRAESDLPAWLEKWGRIGIGGVDTRRLTRAIRLAGAPHVTIAHDPGGNFDIEALKERARGFNGLVGADLAKEVATDSAYDWSEGRWHWPEGFTAPQTTKKVVAIDYGAKRNILRCLTSAGVAVKVLPATATAADILAEEADGLFLSNGPGDPAATGEYAIPAIREVLEKSQMPVFGICLGHQLLALALGAETRKMSHGHHGANHPVKDLESGKVEITSMNHGFTVDAQTLPENVRETHVSLFDGTNCGIAMTDRPVFSVQYHPEASPGPQDSFYLFEKFVQSLS